MKSLANGMRSQCLSKNPTNTTEMVSNGVTMAITVVGKSLPRR